MLELPDEPYYLHDVPTDMDTFIYQYICECGNYDEETTLKGGYWWKAFEEESDVNHELDLGMLELDMIQDLMRHSEEEMKHYKEGLGNLPPLLQNGLQFLDGRHRVQLYQSLGYEKAVSIDLKASGIELDIPTSRVNHVNQMY
jgi:hypothetical protein